MKTLSPKPVAPKEQTGINMVDLMMWLVIAALLLAAAIQGIGYYQKATYLNNMKSDAHGAGTNAFAVAASNDGVVDESILNTAVADTRWSPEITHSVEVPSESGRSPYLRISHPAVPDQDVIYLFDSCGEEYAIGSNVIPKGGSPILEACGITPAAPGGGSGGSGTSDDLDGDGTPNASDTDIDGDGTPNNTDPDIDGDGTPNGSDTTPNGEAATGSEPAPGGTGGTGGSSPNTVSMTNPNNQADSTAMIDRMNAQLRWYMSEDNWAITNGTATSENFANNSADPDYITITTRKPKLDVDEANLRNAAQKADPTGWQTIKDNFLAAQTAYHEDANATSGQALVDAHKAEYDAMLAVTIGNFADLTATPADPSGFQDKFVTAGTNTPQHFSVAVPAGVSNTSATPVSWLTYRTAPDGSVAAAGDTAHTPTAAISDGQGGFYVQSDRAATWHAGYTFNVIVTIQTDDGFAHYKIFNITPQ